MRRRRQPQPEPQGPAPLTREQAQAFLEETDFQWAGRKTLFEQKRCQHCLGVHTRKCPAVAEIEYHPDGKVKRVVYFPEGAWPAEDVIWLEDVIEAAESDD